MSYFVLPSLLYAIVSFSRLITSVAEERGQGFLLLITRNFVVSFKGVSSSSGCSGKPALFFVIIMFYTSPIEMIKYVRLIILKMLFS